MNNIYYLIVNEKCISKFIIDVDENDVNFSHFLYTKIFMILEYFGIENNNGNIIIMKDENKFGLYKEYKKYLN